MFLKYRVAPSYSNRPILQGRLGISSRKDPNWSGDREKAQSRKGAWFVFSSSAARQVSKS